MKKLMLKLQIAFLKALSFVKNPGEFRKNQRYKKSTVLLEKKLKKRVMDNHTLTKKINEYMTAKRKKRNLTPVQMVHLAAAKFKDELYEGDSIKYKKGQLKIVR